MNHRNRAPARQQIDGRRGTSARAPRRAVRAMLSAIVGTLVWGSVTAPVAALPGNNGDPSGWGCDEVDYAWPLPADLVGGRQVDPAPDGRGTWVPVVLVHGWTASAVHDDSRAGTFRSGSI